MTFLYLAAAGFVAWTVSTVAGGGGALILVPVVGFLIGAAAVAPVVTLATMLAEPARIYLFRRSIDWQIVRWYLPGAAVGAFAGAWLFAEIAAEWLQIVLGLFLLSTIWQYRLGERRKSFPVKLWYFLPVGLGVSFVSGLIGTMGPVLNPLYLNYGAVKERMIATKSLNSFVMHIVKVSTYAAFGALTGRLFLYGVAAGAGAMSANWLGKRLLAGMSDRRFRQLVIAVMAVSGAIMIWGQREALLALLGA